MVRPSLGRFELPYGHMRLPLTGSQAARPLAARLEALRVAWGALPPWAVPVSLQVAAVVLWLAVPNPYARL